MTAQQFVDQGYPVSTCCKHLGLARSTYYYRPSVREGSSNPGRKPSTCTLKIDGTSVPNEEVVQDIIALQEHEFVDYGYVKTAHYLRRRRGYIINAKKVYRLMRSNDLLQRKVKHSKGNRTWVKDLIPNTQDPFDYLEFDIKYHYVQGQRRNALCLTVIDVMSRWIMGHYIGWHIRDHHVKDLFDQIFTSYDLPTKMHLRCDNGSQFVSTMIQHYMRDMGVHQEYCKPATPQQNGHIEAYHSIVERVVCQRSEFDNLTELCSTHNRFVTFYNMERIHSGVGYRSPYEYLQEQHGKDMKHTNLVNVLDCTI